jgi:hypothetical protein
MLFVHLFIRIERPQEPEGYVEIVQERMSPMVTATESCDILHTTEPGLFEEANLDFRGKLKPGLIITFTWSGPRVVAGYTEAHACAWHVCQLSLSDP